MTLVVNSKQFFQLGWEVNYYVIIIYFSIYRLIYF
jgi:hypothetical protein